MKIAIVDDDPIFQFITKKMLEKGASRHEIFRFDDGQEALAYIQANRSVPEALPELILLDINMPGLNGWQFLEALRRLDAIDYQPRIYIVSSSADPVDYLQSQTYGELKGYLKKPLSMQQLTGLFIDKA